MIYRLLICVITCQLLIACGKQPKSNYQDAVIEIWNHERHAEQIVIEEIAKAEDSDFLSAEWLSAREKSAEYLDGLDVSKCPKDFQDAWKDYLDATNDLNSAFEATAKTGDEAEEQQARQQLADTMEKMFELYQKYAHSELLELN